MAMDDGLRLDDPEQATLEHRRITGRLLVETIGIWALLSGVAVWAVDRPWWQWLPVVILQGCWLERLYVVAHEAVHGKLWPEQRRVNDGLGQLLLLPLGIPLPVYRKIHAFHHARNRRDPHTSALDVYVLPSGASRARRLACYLAWYGAVFAGGWFVHGLVSILLFLALPLSVARRVSPAFHGWSQGDRLRSVGLVLLAVALHAGVGALAGAQVWAAVLGYPLLSFAWVYSLLVYVFHYRTPLGPTVRTHARSLDVGPIASWWLLKFHHHAVHHLRPGLAWHRLEAHAGDVQVRHPLPGEGQGLLAAIVYQLRGPWIVEEPS